MATKLLTFLKKVDASQFSTSKKSDGTETDCQHSAKNTTIPCNLTTLRVTDDTSQKTVRCIAPMTGFKPDPDAPRHVRDRLAVYDLVLEVLADPQTHTAKPPDTPAVLVISYKYEGNCPHGEHALLTYTGSAKEDIAESRSWRMQTPTPVKVYAHGLGAGIWLAPYWHFGTSVKEMVVTAQSCGVTGNGRPAPALNCLVRVYDKDTYVLSFSIPSFKRWNYGYKTERFLGTGTSSTSSSYTNSTFGNIKSQIQNSSSSSSTTNKDGFKNISNTSSTSTIKGDNYTSNSQKSGIENGQIYNEWKDETGTVKGGLIYQTKDVTTTSGSSDTGKITTTPSHELEVTPVLSLKRNGVEVDGTKILNTLIKAATDFHENVVKPLQEINSWMPKVGFTFDIDVAVMKGIINCTWGNRHPANAPTGGRWVAVESYFSLTVDLLVLGLDLKLGFGVDITSPALLDFFAAEKLYEIVLMISLTLQMAATVKATVSERSTSTNSPSPVRITGSAAPELAVTGKVSLFGTRLVEVKLGITGQVSFEGELSVSLKEHMKITGEAKRAVTKVSCYFISKDKSRTELLDKVIYPEASLWKGTMPS
ncbi:hypothetical protein [Azospirillum argentinense]|uniref:hypothetical protein n=1 Tax=Azospirillum argentinense TaxID=2970906 RepID=UPI0032DE63F5